MRKLVHLNLSIEFVNLSYKNSTRTIFLIIKFKKDKKLFYNKHHNKKNIICLNSFGTQEYYRRMVVLKNMDIKTIILSVIVQNYHQNYSGIITKTVDTVI